MAVSIQFTCIYTHISIITIHIDIHAYVDETAIALDQGAHEGVAHDSAAHKGPVHKGPAH